MFQINEKSAGLPKEMKEKVLSVFNSINEPKIAAADHAAEPTQAFICSVREGEMVGMHIVLYLTKSKVRVVYSWDKAVSPKNAKDIEAEALDFVESMGFMMDNMNVGKFSEAQKKDLINSMPVFVEEKVAVEDEPLLLTEEAVELEELGSLADAPTAVASSIGAKFKERAHSAGEFDEGKSLAMMEEEFEREEPSVDAELASIFGAEKPAPTKPAKPAELSPESGQARAILRILASL